eukprot:TRINITY_DN5483_c0_g1_i1.p1 TRINITY_DN5483_c0_g1~~TRINITY_DN5483_c0_g1_i1.p1  ORF type:complete len:476 (+),score=51.46 TRINITY_DN5483_c0_g1_i1:25-1452(+)
MGEGDPVYGTPGQAINMPTLQSSSCKVYKRRWYILGLFMMIALQQSNIWITYGATSATTQELYDIDASWVNALSNAGPVAFIVFYPISSWAIGALGLRFTIVTAAGLVASGAVMRVFCNGHSTFWLVGTGQLLNAAAGPILMTVPPAISGAWFAIDERTLATAMASLVGYLGGAVGFVVGIPVQTPADLRLLLYIEGGVALFFFILCVIYFPAAPPTPPTLSATRRQTHNTSASSVDEEHRGLIQKDSKVDNHHHHHGGQHDGKTGWRLLLSQSISLMVTKDSSILFFCGGILSGIYSGWQSVLINILLPLGYSQSEGQWLGFINSAVGMVSGLLIGKIHDKYYKQFKSLLLIIYACTAASFAVFTLSTEGLFFKNSATVLIYVSNVVGGFAINAFVPIVLEALGEVTFPSPEDIGSGLVSLLNNIACFVFIFISDYIPPVVMNWLLTGAAVVAFLLTLFVKQRYTRSEFDLHAS